ncbi:hypothetical protein BDQ17DRAFT_1348855 [Cyathus striatus]|nr:hypothetical protein BDQ17DRAFT_1348855 [Cyathus striatus]
MSSHSVTIQDIAKQLHSDTAGPTESLKTSDTLGTTAVQKEVMAEGEQALESHEVIELQTFSERKVWIEEKIKFLERMPPVDVFVGLDAIRTSSEEIPGLPSRTELQQWITEHDSIEKETEIFDKGELKKLRQLTKAATQRNLSPEDTDVIELTLTTIKALDKLLHLLRDRSENLDLLGIRLTWEESRLVSWIDRRKILEDLRNFLDSRARWNKSVYSSMSKSEEQPGLTRRGSVTSFSSITSDSSISLAAFSRSARFKLAELLSRDAAQFSGRISSLRHSKIAAAGKALDKLIDNSRRPVPEELLDEQDRLEEKGINDLEHIDKFIMAIVMQWRKADEIYVETIKDQLSAQNLLEEIETANLYHPTARQSSSFISRVDTLLKRLLLRGNPSSARSTFPCPEHPLFSDQKAFNEALMQGLSTEIAIAADIVQKADAAAKEYRLNCDSVKRVDQLRQFARDLSETFKVIIEQLEHGVLTAEGDGSPPNLNVEQCLEPTRHSVFIAFLPSILDKLSTANNRTDGVIKDFEVAMQALNFPGLDESFKSESFSDIRGLHDLQKQARELHGSVSQRVSDLRYARKISLSMEELIKELLEIQELIFEAIEKYRWRKESGNTLLTPETPKSSIDISSNFSVAEFEVQLSTIRNRLSLDIDPSVHELSSRIGDPLKGSLSCHAHDVAAFLDVAKGNLQILESVQQQATAMLSIREEFNTLQIQSEDLRLRFDSASTDLLLHKSVDADMDLLVSKYQGEMDSIQATIVSFVDILPSRVPFVARQPRKSVDSGDFARRRFSTHDTKTVAVSPLLLQVERPVDTASIDADVRADSNSYIMRLNGSLENLRRLLTQLRLVRMAVQIDRGVSSILKDISDCTQQSAVYKETFAKLMENPTDLEARLRDMMKSIEESFTSHRARISRSFSPLREVLYCMEQDGKKIDISVYDTICVTRRRALDNAEAQLRDLEQQMTFFKDEIEKALTTETQRQHDIRAAEEKQIRDEELRIAAKEAERLHQEQLKLQREELQRREEERLQTQALLEAERTRAAVDEAERAHQEHEKMESERKKAIEERLAVEMQHHQAERELLALQTAEHALLSRERDEIKERLRQVEEELAAEKLARRCFDESQGSSSELMTIDELGPYSNDDAANDAFGVRVIADSAQSSKSRATPTLQADIASLRKRLRSLCINEAVWPNNPSTLIPGEEKLNRIVDDFAAISTDVEKLHAIVKGSVDGAELQSLKVDVQESSELLRRLENLVDFSKAVALCDGALSDLLEHIDSYPAPPVGSLTSSHQIDSSAMPMQQMTSRITFTRGTILHMDAKYAIVDSDPRASSERSRILQTWMELEEMGNDQLRGKKSRSSSVISSRNSSGRNSRVSITNPGSSKKSGFSTLTVSSISRGKLLTPPLPSSRRASSGSNEIPSRSSSRLSVSSSTRSVSGPLNISSTLYKSTFASRQRTTSLTASASTAAPNKRPPLSPLRSRAQTGHSQRSVSPTMSESSAHSRSFVAHSRTSMSSLSSWARAPRNSLSSLIPNSTTLQTKTTPLTRKKYVADPKSKLDVAVGDVVNKLPVGINVEGVSETWKDQSGKYWIGNQDPKLCFCRILRSQTVMVRVGGGWTELSKFIREHFADSFRILSESPPRAGAQVEKWISSATLLESAEGYEPFPPPRTPEPTFPFVPTFALSTPSNRSPHSLRSSPSTKGSPLTPLQFMRRAELDASVLRPATPSKSPLHNRNAPVNISTRQSIWRP